MRSTRPDATPCTLALAPANRLLNPFFCVRLCELRRVAIGRARARAPYAPLVSPTRTAPLATRLRLVSPRHPPSLPYYVCIILVHVRTRNKNNYRRRYIVVIVFWSVLFAFRGSSANRAVPCQRRRALIVTLAILSSAPILFGWCDATRRHGPRCSPRRYTTTSQPADRRWPSRPCQLPFATPRPWSFVSHSRAARISLTAGAAKRSASHELYVCTHTYTYVYVPTDKKCPRTLFNRVTR